MLPRLNFPEYDIRVARKGLDVSVWDTLRRVWLRLTPEEWVRQHLIRYLVEECGAPTTSVAQEFVVTLGGRPQRADVVVHGHDGHPLLLAECKAPQVEIDTAVFAQAIRYNSAIGARYIIVTNGLRHCVRELMPDGKYRALEKFPQLAPTR